MGLRNAIIGVFLLGQVAVFGQNEADILFKVDDIDVPVSEFEYIYEKNNRAGADYTEYSLREYLDLYAKFKLKVKKAKDLQLDTITSLKTELEGYRSQLARSYLNDREVMDRLTREAYDRMQEDVRVAHILLRIPRNAPSNVESTISNQAMDAHKRIVEGTDFAEVAKQYSSDKATRDNGGDLGYLTAMLPKWILRDGDCDVRIGEGRGLRTYQDIHRVSYSEKTRRASCEGQGRDLAYPGQGA